MGHFSVVVFWRLPDVAQANFVVPSGTITTKLSSEVFLDSIYFNKGPSDRQPHRHVGVESFSPAFWIETFSDAEKSICRAAADTPPSPRPHHQGSH